MKKSRRKRKGLNVDRFDVERRRREREGGTIIGDINRLQMDEFESKIKAKKEIERKRKKKEIERRRKKIEEVDGRGKGKRREGCEGVERRYDNIPIGGYLP